MDFHKDYLLGHIEPMIIYFLIEKQTIKVNFSMEQGINRKTLRPHCIYVFVELNFDYDVF